MRELAAIIQESNVHEPFYDVSSSSRSIRRTVASVRTFAVRSLGDLKSSAFQKHRQKPSSARPTQLNANTEEATATTDAKVAKVLTNGITEPRFRPRLNSVERLLPNQDGNSPRLILNPTVAAALQPRRHRP